MFQYTNTIVLNSLKDATTGLDKLVPGVNQLEVRRVQVFKKDNVQKIYKRAASDPVIGSAMFTMAQANKGVYRLKLYIRLSGSQNSYYSNDFVFKGKPLVFEYRIANDSTSGADVAKEVKRVIEKIQALYGDKWIKASVSGDKLTIHGTDEYQLFTEAKIQKLNESANHPLTNDAFEDIAQGTIIPCREGFGTYLNILKDLRLPTLEARRFEAVNQEELPIPGIKYNQYTIYYKVDRGLFGGAAVGQQVTSMTTHVFYVAEAISADFEAELNKLKTVEEEKAPIIIKSGIEDIADLPKAGSPAKDITPVIEGGTLKQVTATCDADWITITPSSSKVSFTGTDNSTSATRTTTAQVICIAESGAAASQEITITQLSE